jgi:hypothetical protein
LSTSPVEKLVGEIVGVSEADKVGGGVEGVFEGWFTRAFSAICAGEGLELLCNAGLLGEFTRACNSGRASRDSTIIFIVIISARLSGEIRMLCLAFLALFGAGCDSSGTSGLDVIRM